MARGLSKGFILTIALAAALWTLMFLPLTAPHLPFWWVMTLSALTLSTLASMFRPGWWRCLTFRPSDFLWGIGLAVGLWCVFWVGDKVSAWLFGFARPQVDLIYGMKEGESPWLLSALMLLIIGPAEEIFWRGYVQHRLSERFSPNRGFIYATLLYALVHVASCNFMLIMAAAVAGTVWGLFYRIYPDRLTPLIISHALWDAAVFIWFPI